MSKNMNPDHLQIVDNDRDAVRRWQADNRNDLGLNLSGCSFEDRDLSGYRFECADFTKTNFSGANLSGATFDRCVLIGAIFCKARGERFPVTFLGGNLDDADFTNCHFQHLELREVVATRVRFTNAHVPTARLDRVELKECCFCGANLSAAEMINSTVAESSFRSASLVRASLTRTKLTKVEFSHADFFEASIEAGEWSGLSGLHNSYRLESANVLIEPKYIADCERGWAERYCDWEKVRTFGRMPLFGLSYSGLVLIPSYIYILAWYNHQVERLNKWQGPANKWIGGHLQPLPMPSLYLLLLSSTVLLAIASTLYTVACPARIKEFTKDVWCDQLNKPLLHYWPVSWKFRTLRLISMCCYLFGGSGAIVVLICKIWNAGRYIIENSPL